VHGEGGGKLADEVAGEMACVGRRQGDLTISI